MHLSSTFEKEHELKIINLTGWCCRTREIIKTFHLTHFQHIFRQYNALVDGLSKIYLGCLHIQLILFKTILILFKTINYIFSGLFFEVIFLNIIFLGCIVDKKGKTRVNNLLSRRRRKCECFCRSNPQ